ncbi:MAG: hypothetical protein ACRDSZ_08995 [Pseudonocardiaceae bacterium]
MSELTELPTLTELRKQAASCTACELYAGGALRGGQPATCGSDAASVGMPTTSPVATANSVDTSAPCLVTRRIG